MTPQETRKKIFDKLTKEEVMNDSIRKSLDSTNSVTQIKNISTKILKKKKRLIEIEGKLKEKNIRVWFDTKIILRHLDGNGYKRIVKKTEEILSFLKKKKKTIQIANKNRFPNRIIGALEKCNDKIDLEKVLDEIPPLLLVKVGLKKLKTSSQISSGKSIRAISTPMRD
jgi:hypothetical protein